MSKNVFCSAKSAFFNLRNVKQSSNTLNPHIKFKLCLRAPLGFCHSERVAWKSKRKTGGNTTQQHQKAMRRTGQKKKGKTQPQFHSTEKLSVLGQRREHGTVQRRTSGSERAERTDSKVQLPPVTQSVSAGSCLNVGLRWAEMSLTSWLYEGKGEGEGDGCGMERCIANTDSYQSSNTTAEKIKST